MCCGYPWVRESYLNHAGKPLSLLPLITDFASCFLPATLFLKMKCNRASRRLLGWADLQSLRWGLRTSACLSRRAPAGHSLSGLLSRDRFEARVRFLLFRGYCFPTNSKGLRTECRWVSSPSCCCHLDITMAIILPETKIKGRTGWTESVATNSCSETESWWWGSGGGWPPRSSS